MRGRKPAKIAVAGAPITEAPRPPAWLSKDAKAEWRHILPLLIERGVLTETDLAMVEAFCIAAGLAREIERARQKAGAIIDPKLMRLQMQALQSLRQIGAEIGATPVSRSRPAIQEKKDAGYLSPLDI